MGVVGLRGIPDVMGGVETHCEQLYPRIVRVTDDIDVVILGRSPYVGPQAYTFEGVRVRPVWTVRSVLFETIVHSALAIATAAFAERCKVVHLHALGPNLMAPLARLLGMKVVATHHGRDYDREKWGWLSRQALRAGERMMTLFAHQILCVDASDARRLRARHARRAVSIHAMPNGAAIAAPDMQADPLGRFGLTAGSYVLAVGRLVPEKNFHDLIAAFERAVGDGGGNLRKLVIVGGDDHDGAYSRALRQKASDRVIFTGVLRRGEVSALLAGAGLFVLPSSHEGHPLVAMEALAAGAPVLLSDIQPNQEIGLAPAHYFPVGDVAALARILGRADQDALRNRDPEVLRRYDWDDIAARTARLLRETGET